jgi:hypothetical protein
MPVLGTDNADNEFLAITESGDDNVLLGLAFDFTTTNLQLTDPRDDSGDTKLPPCPVLLCLSLGGKLSLFSVARYVSSLHPKSKETNIAIDFCIECIACPTSKQRSNSSMFLCSELLKRGILESRAVSMGSF